MNEPDDKVLRCARRGSVLLIEKLAHAMTRVVELVLVLLLVGMVIMVFGNVVLRYGFNSGITISEELSRYFFVWLTFTGAVLAFAEHGHIGVETVVKRMPRAGRVTCMALVNAIVLLCAAVIFRGTWVQHPINASMTGAVVGIPMIWVFGIGYFTALGIGLIAVLRLARILAGGVTDEEIARFAGELEEYRAGGE